MSTRLQYGSERIRLLVTSSRIIVDHGGKRGPGAVAGTTILGQLSSGLEGLFKSGGDSRKKKKMEKLGPSQVLRAHKDNFAIGYGQVRVSYPDPVRHRSSSLLKDLRRQDDHPEITRTTSTSLKPSMLESFSHFSRLSFSFSHDWPPCQGISLFRGIA